MREIKFRAWDPLSEVMIDWFAMTQSGYNVDASMPLMWSIFTGSHDAELMQYAGLNDKNGVEIYEGDIISSNVNCIFDKGRHCNEVIYKEDQFTAVNCSLKMVIESFNGVVEGNIFENPELLEKS